MLILDNVASGAQNTIKSSTGQLTLRCSGGSALIKLDVTADSYPMTGTTYHTLLAGEGITVDIPNGDTILVEANAASTTIDGGPT